MGEYEFEFPASAAEFPFPSTTVVERTPDDKVSLALDSLLNHNILSLPVFETASKTYIGTQSFSLTSIVVSFTSDLFS